MLEEPMIEASTIGEWRPGAPTIAVSTTWGCTPRGPMIGASTIGALMTAA
jgi:hypothetical protein